MKFEKYASKNGSHVHRSGEPRVGRGSGAVSPSSLAREPNIERRCSSYGSPDKRGARRSDVGLDPLKDPKTEARRLRTTSTGPDGSWPARTSSWLRTLWIAPAPPWRARLLLSSSL